MADNRENSLHYGGQAVIEGVMMRGKKHFAVACRRSDGEIVVTSEHVEKGVLGKLKWLNRPFLRGTLALVDSLTLGMKALMWSSTVAMDEGVKPESEGKSGTGDSAKPKSSAVTDIALSATMFISLAMAVLFFKFVPTYLTKWTVGHYTDMRVWLGITEGGIRLTFFFLYIWGISFMKDIHRVFQYHGAEHKVINAFEAGEELTVENVQKYSTVHVRCGTSFLLIFIITSIIVFAAIPWQFAKGLPIWHMALLRVGYQLPLLPFVAGIAYEIIKLAGSRKESKVLRLILGLGLLMQRLTTQPPTDDMVEVAIASFQGVRTAEEAELAA